MKELIEVQKELKVPKCQYNSFGKYKYRSAEDILEAVKPLLHKHGCLLTISDEIVMIGDRYYIKATASITNGEEIVQTTAYAREDEDKKGMDGSQLSGATSSYARKYCLGGLFLLDDSKDADTDEFKEQQKASKETAKETPVKMASPVQLKRLKEFYGEKFESYLKTHKLKSESEITMALADETIRKITEYERSKG